MVFIKLKPTRFFVLLKQNESWKEVKPKVAEQLHKCILVSLNKISDTSMDDLPKTLPPCRKVDHKIKVVHGSILLAETLYRLNQKELEELKTQINNLFNW